MITNFEEITKELTEQEMKYVPILIQGFKNYTEANPIKAAQVCENLNKFFEAKKSRMRIDPPRLRKCVNYIRANGLIPLIATTNGYFVSYDKEVIEAQIKSLNEIANSILSYATGLELYTKS